MSINDATPDQWDSVSSATGVPTSASTEEMLNKYQTMAEEEAEGLWTKVKKRSGERGGFLGPALGLRVPIPRTTPEEPTTEVDPVNNPSHYNTGGVEAIQAIEASMPTEAFQGYLKGNCMKYIWRMSYKGKAKEDTLKAQWYLNRLIETL